MDAQALERSWLRVRRLAERYPDEWGGEDLDGEDPLRVFAGKGAARRVLVVTQEAALRRWERSDWPAGLVVVVAVGLVTRAQAGLIERLAADKSVPIAFLGSASPMCLHTFLSLQVHLGARRIRYSGISDSLFETIGEEDLMPERLRAWDLSAFDKAQLRVVATLAKPERFLGPGVAAVLRSGRAIGIEHLCFRAGLIRTVFRATLKLAWARQETRKELGPGRLPGRRRHQSRGGER